MNRLSIYPVVAIAVAACSMASQVAPTAPLEPLASLELSRYLGTWYQVALYPNTFQSQ